MRFVFFFFKQKTAYEITRRDWSSDVCSSDLVNHGSVEVMERGAVRGARLADGSLATLVVLGDEQRPGGEPGGGVVVQRLEQRAEPRRDGLRGGQHLAHVLVGHDGVALEGVGERRADELAG